MNEKITKWFTRVTYVDQDTGELITRKKVLNKEYIIIEKDEKYKQNGTVGEKDTTYVCRQNQGTLFE